MNDTAPNSPGYELVAEYWLDRQYILTRCSRHSPVPLGHVVGRSLWDVFPEGEPIFKHIYERAFTDGTAEGEGFYGGKLVAVYAMVEDRELHVVVRLLAEIDPTTLGTLLESLDRVIAASGSLPGPVLAGRLSPAPVQARPVALRLLS